MNIAIIYSPNWGEYALIETYAFLKTNKGNHNVYLISDDDGEVDYSPLLDKFGDVADIHFISAEEKFKKRIYKNTNVSARFTKYALYRLLLPELIDEDRLLHIDADAIINGDISEMYNMEMDDCYIAGAIDIGAEQYNLKKPINLSSKDPYINAGVLLMNLKKIREDKVNEKWIRDINDKFFLSHDQCVLNKWSKGKLKLFDNSYNCSISTGLSTDRQVINIAHFAGNLKPWMSGEVPHARIWFDWVRDYKKNIKSGEK